MPPNPRRSQRLALRELREGNDLKVYPFDKGTGFAIMQKDDAISKLREQIGDAKVCDCDPTDKLTGKFQRVIRQLKKDGKNDINLFREMYPSDAVPPRMYGLVKAHKPSKGYPMRTVVSTLGTPFYGTSAYLVRRIQPTLNKNPIRITNSAVFVSQAKDWDIDPDEKQVSFDVTALYPSVPIKKAIDVIMDILKSDEACVQQRTLLHLSDIRKLLQMCLSTCYFLWNDELYEIEDTGPIGLSLMVVIADGFLQHLESRAIAIALNRHVAPKTFFRYVDDSHFRFDTTEQALEFMDILNSLEARIQYTIEEESPTNTLAFLDILITNNRSRKYEFAVYRKPAITNVMIKPTSSVDPKIAPGVFKGFLARAMRICSKNRPQEEVEFLRDVFVENGYDYEVLNKIIKNYTSNLIRVRDIQTTATDSKQLNNTVKLPWIPVIGPKLRRIYRKKGFNVVFTSLPNLAAILCKNKCPLPQNSEAGVYSVDCKCGANYIGETKKRVCTRVTEHQKAAEGSHWQSSGLSEHCRDCNAGILWSEAKTICRETDYWRRKVREGLEIKRIRPSMNRDEGFGVSDAWNTLFV